MALRLNGASSGYTEIDAAATAGNNLVTLPTGTGAVPLMKLETEKSATGGSVDFTGIPSWVKKITVMISGLSVNAASTTNVRIQIGDSGGIEATGYTSSSYGTVLASSNAQGVTSTTGYVLNYAVLDSATNTYYGSVILTNLSGNTWVASGTFHSANQGSYLAGTKTLSGTLDRLSVVTDGGTDVFDAGTINLLLEG